MDIVFWNTEPRRSKVFTRYIGPYKIAHWMRKHGYHCQVIDFILNFTEDELYTVTKKFITTETIAICLSTTFLSIDDFVGNSKNADFYFINVLKRLKEEFPNLKVVTGGYGSDKQLSWGVVDATVMSYNGASEDIFLEYIDHFRYGNQLPGGTLHTASKVRMIYNHARTPKYNIETDDFKFVEHDVILPNEVLPLDISRGCIFKCKFCHYPHLGKKKLDYIRDMALIREELIHNYETFGVNKYFILDDTFNDTPWKVTQFLKITDSLPFKIKFFSYLRADLIDAFPETALQLQEAGLWGAFFGIESLHLTASNIIGKGWSGKHARSFIPNLYHTVWNGQVPMQLNFIVGLPEDTEQSQRDTAAWIVSNDLYTASFAPLGFYIDTKNPGTSINSEFERDYKKYGFDFDLATNEWYNNSWTQHQTVELANELKAQIYPHRKAYLSKTLPLLFLGYPEHQILNSTVDQLNLSYAEKLTQEQYRIYYQKLMDL